MDSFTNDAGDTVKLRKLVLLFDVAKDESEKKEVSEDFPDITNQLLEKLADHYVSYRFKNIVHYFN